MRHLLFPFFLVFGFCLAGCSSASDDVEQPVKRSGKSILTFSISEYPEAEVTIREAENVIDVLLPIGVEFKNITPVFTLSEGATSDPASGTTMDLSQSQIILVYAEDGLYRSYVVKAANADSSMCEIKAISLPDYFKTGRIENNKITFDVRYGTKSNALKFDIKLSDDATVMPDITAEKKYTFPLELTVTAADGKTKNVYTLEMNEAAQERAIRGIYLPDPSHTKAFNTYAAAKASIDLLDELNFNVLFISTLARNMTCFDSQVLADNSSFATPRDGNYYKNYTGGSGDMVKDVIELAHAKGIKVIFWFEYGFMAEWRAKGTGGVTAESSPIYAAHPEWIGINSKGEQSNYNGTDYYFNSYLPEVQNFMLDFIDEAITKYPEIDGVQGDDRMPAAPRDSGYDTYTRELYKTQKGTYPPSNPDDPTWVQWRLDILNKFAVAIHSRVKAKNPKMIVCYAPNKYPWCEGALMQQWPQWIKDGAAELITVQCYVPTSYRLDVYNSMQTIKGITNKPMLNPAMILKNGSTILSDQELIDQLDYNRQVGTNGESQFWFEGLYEPRIKKIFKAYYPGKAIFSLE